MYQLQLQILEHLLAIRCDVGTVREELRELKSRLVNLEGRQAYLMQSLGYQAGGAAAPHVSYDRVIDRIAMIERMRPVIPS